MRNVITQSIEALQLSYKLSQLSYMLLLHEALRQYRELGNEAQKLHDIGIIKSYLYEQILLTGLSQRPKIDRD